MRVFHVDRQRSWTGQINRTSLLLHGLRERGFDVGAIVHPGAQLGVRSREAGIEVIELPMRGWRFYPSVWRLGSKLRRRGVDVLHAHGPRDHFLGVLAQRRGRVRHLVRTKHNHTALRSGPFSRWLFHRCSAIDAVSDFAAAALVKDGIAAERITTIPDGVDLDRFTPRPRDAALAAAWGMAPDDVVIGNVSSLHRRKGIEELLRAFAVLAREPGRERLRCLLVGKQTDEWRALAAQLGVADRVVLPGFHADVPAALSLLDLYVLPSHEEALGTSVLEAMACEVPVVVGDVGGLRESVAPEVGVRVPPEDVPALTGAVRSLLDAPDRAGALGRAGRVRVVERYSATAMIDQTAALYRGLG